MKSKVIDIMIIAVLMWAVLSIPSYRDTVEQVWKATERPVVVIDPGHGGMDGGAEGGDGTAEKDVNLKISLKLKDHMEKAGVRVIMTRDSDTGLYDEGEQGTIRYLKTKDMHERKRIIDEAGADLVISIHLNSFTQDGSVKGAQVFYPSAGADELVEKSCAAAEIVQENLNLNINTDKKRTELGKDDVYLLQNVTCPIIITECGFLSNDEDLNNLKKDKFQEEIAKSLKVSICKYLEENGNKTQ